MKVLKVDEAQAQFEALCAEALTGEVIRVEFPGGAQIELTAIQAESRNPALSDEQLSESYNDAEWANFENRCGEASR